MAIRIKGPCRGARYAPHKSGEGKGCWIKEADIEAWLQKVRGPGLKIATEGGKNLLKEDMFRVFHYEKKGLKGFVTFCRTVEKEFWFQHCGGGRYGVGSDYNYEERS